jgi:hypothetical protein
MPGPLPITCCFCSLSRATHYWAAAAAEAHRLQSHVGGHACQAVLCVHDCPNTRLRVVVATYTIAGNARIATALRDNRLVIVAPGRRELARDGNGKEAISGDETEDDWRCGTTSEAGVAYWTSLEQETSVVQQRSTFQTAVIGYAMPLAPSKHICVPNAPRLNQAASWKAQLHQLLHSHLGSSTLE